MDKHMTRRELMNRYPHVIEVGYCGAQFLLNGLPKIGYNAGLYGWNWDAYELGRGVAICTGYRNMTGDHSKETRDLVDKYEKKAREAYDARNYERIPQLRAEFIAHYYALID